MEQTTEIYAFLEALFFKELAVLQQDITIAFSEHLNIIVPSVLILVLSLLAYRVLLFQDMSLKTFMTTVLKIVLVLTIFSAVTTYFDLFQEGKEAFDGMITALVPLNAEIAYAQLDQMIIRTIRNAEYIKSSDEPFSFSWATFISYFYVFGAFLLTAIIFMLIIIIDLFLVILTVLGLLFFLLLLFESTQSYFKDWVKAILSLFLTKLIIMMAAYLVIKVYLAIGQDLATKELVNDQNMGNSGGITIIRYSYDWGRLIGIFVWEVIGIVFVLASVKLASALTAGMGMAIADSHRPVTNMAKDFARGMKNYAARASGSAFRGSRNNLQGAKSHRENIKHDKESASGNPGEKNTTLPIHNRDQPLDEISHSPQTRVHKAENNKKQGKQSNSQVNQSGEKTTQRDSNHSATKPSESNSSQTNDSSSATEETRLPQQQKPSQNTSTKTTTIIDRANKN